MSPARFRHRLEALPYGSNVIGEWYVRPDPEVPAGFISGQIPWAGQRARSYYGLTIVISAGPNPLRKLDVDLCRYTPRDCSESERTPRPMSVLDPGTVLEGEPVRVPAVVGRSRAEAERLLTDGNLQYRVVAIGGTSDRVDNQRPAPGSTLPASSAVVLRVSCRPGPSPPDGAFLVDACSGENVQAHWM
jgi:beta-lactam-binding protein with PASTA domain